MIVKLKRGCRDDCNTEDMELGMIVTSCKIKWEKVGNDCDFKHGGESKAQLQH